MVEEKINHIAVKTKELEILQKNLVQKLWEEIKKGNNKVNVTSEHIEKARKNSLDAK